MAQSVERVLGKDEVTGSNPVSSSKKRTQAFSLVFFFAIIMKYGDLRHYQGIVRAPKNNFARQKNFREEEQVDCKNYRLLRQTVEKSELRRKDEVTGSNPVNSSINKKGNPEGFPFYLFCSINWNLSN